MTRKTRASDLLGKAPHIISRMDFTRAWFYGQTLDGVLEENFLIYCAQQSVGMSLKQLRLCLDKYGGCKHAGALALVNREIDRRLANEERKLLKRSARKKAAASSQEKQQRRL